MAVVVGIDEAGYGPRLGPLVITAAAFRVRDELAEAPLWDLMAPVAGRGSRSPGLIPVDDSKRLFSQALGVRRLERTALAFAAVAGVRAATFRALLGALAAIREDPDAYPWYRGWDAALPREAMPDQRERDAARLLGLQGVEFLGARLAPVLTGELNRMIEAHGTKAAALFLKTADLLAWAWERWGEDGLLVRADKHGGRNRYGLLIHQTFFGAEVRTAVEGRDASQYLVRRGPRRMAVGFYKDGDARYLPVALASVFSKYVRELFMESFNAYWTGRVPGLRPTAGYGADARRFLDQLAAAQPLPEAPPLARLA